MQLTARLFSLSFVASRAAASAFLDAATDFLGGGQGHIEDAQQELQTMFRALPKNIHGNLDQEMSRYALHRHFTQKHGWHFHQLAPKDAGELFDQRSLSEELEEHLPNSMLEFLDKEADGVGLGLPQLAALAATLERLVLDNTKALLKRAFFLEGLQFGVPTRKQEVLRVLETHAILLVLGTEVDNVTRVRGQMPMIFQRWEELLALVRAQDAIQGSADVLAAGRILESAQDISHGLSELQTRHCDHLRSELERRSSPGSGRVPLRVFSSATADATEDTMLFSEDVAMMRSLGAVDESDTQEPQVIVPNYLLSSTNCLGSVGFFQTCCNNRCDAWLAKLEGELQSPEPSPGATAEVLDRFQGASGDVAKQMAVIAAQNAGVVPLHSRDFAQWMHDQFPTMCPRPPSGNPSTMDAEDWEEFTGEGFAAAQHFGFDADDEVMSEDIEGTLAERFVGEQSSRAATTQDWEEFTGNGFAAAQHVGLDARGEVMEEDHEGALAEGLVEEQSSKAATSQEDVAGRHMGWAPMGCMLAAAAAMLVNLVKTVGSMKRGFREQDAPKRANEATAKGRKVK